MDQLFAAASHAAFGVLLVLTQQRQGELSYRREIARGMACAHHAFVLSERDIKHQCRQFSIPQWPLAASASAWADEM